MVRTTVADLRVPAPTSGVDYFKNNIHQQEFTGKHVATVSGAPTGGAARVILQGGYVNARIATTAKNVRDGDRVIVVKQGGVWTITEVETWHEPPTVSKPSVTPPSNASTVSGAPSGTVSSTPNIPTGQVLPTVTNYEARMKDVLGYIGRLDNWINNAVSPRLNSLMSHAGSVQNVVNTNATRTNEVRNAAMQAADSVGPMHDALVGDRIIK